VCTFLLPGEADLVPVQPESATEGLAEPCSLKHIDTGTALSEHYPGPMSDETQVKSTTSTMDSLSDSRGPMAIKEEGNFDIRYVADSQGQGLTFTPANMVEETGEQSSENGATRSAEADDLSTETGGTSNRSSTEQDVSIVDAVLHSLDTKSHAPSGIGS